MRAVFICRTVANILMALFLTAAAVTAAPFPVADTSNEQWKYLGANDKGEQFFYDAASIVNFSKDIIQVWTRELAPNTAPTRKLKEINCGFRIIRDRQIMVEKTDTRAPSLQNRLSAWHAVEKDPVTMNMYKALCR